jgi:hypothetical protein
MLNTLRLIQRLREAGFERGQAEKAAEALVEAILGSDFATRADVREEAQRLVQELVFFSR